MEIARTHLDSPRAPEELRGLDLEVASVMRGRGAATIRLRQRHQGLPVLGSAVAVRVGDGGRVLRVNGEVTRELPGWVPPALSAENASERASQVLGVLASQLDAPRLAVAGLPEGGRLVWEVLAASMPGGEALWIDASDGAVRARKPLAREVLGRIFSDDPVCTPELEERELQGLAPHSPLRAADGLLSVFQYTGGGNGKFSGEASVGPSSGVNFLYNPPKNPKDPADPFAAVNAYYHGRRAQDFFTNTLGVEMGGEPWRLAIVVNAREGGKPMNNAYFSPLGLSGEAIPNVIALGQGDVDFAQESDVLLHEYTHHVTHQAIDFSGGQFAVDVMGMAPMGGSIDEGLADYFAATINGSPVLGEALPEELRRDISAKGKRCPEDTLGEVHNDGAIISSAAWEIREILGPELADTLLWESVSMLTSRAQPQDFAEAVGARAEELQQDGVLSSLDLAEIKASMASRGLTECGRTLSLNEGQHRSGLWGMKTIAKLLGKSCQQAASEVSLQSSFNYVFKPSAAATRVRFRVALKAQGATPLRWSLLVKEGSPVSFHPGKKGFPIPEEAPHQLADIREDSGELVVDVEPGGPELHAVLLHKNCDQSRLFLEAIEEGVSALPSSQGSLPEKKSQETSEAGEDGHTGCNLSGHREDSWQWWVFALALRGRRYIRKERSANSHGPAPLGDPPR